MIIWGQESKFGDPKCNNYMIYYGILILNVFIGVGFIVKKVDPPKERSDIIKRKWDYGYCRSEL